VNRLGASVDDSRFAHIVGEQQRQVGAQFVLSPAVEILDDSHARQVLHGPQPGTVISLQLFQGSAKTLHARGRLFTDAFSHPDRRYFEDATVFIENLPEKGEVGSIRFCASYQSMAESF
jgi:hypothetical protein